MAKKEITLEDKWKIDSKIGIHFIKEAPKKRKKKKLLKELKGGK